MLREASHGGRSNGRRRIAMADYVLLFGGG